MLKYKKNSLVLIFSLCVLPASARDVTGKITDLITFGDGHTVVKIENSPVNGCSSQYYYSIGIKGQDVKAEIMFSVALSAYMANRVIHVSTANGVCQGGEEKVNYIQLFPGV